MGRVKNAKNKTKETITISPEERLRILANLVIDRILEEQKAGKLDQITQLIKQHG